jgi:hypothetical protein
MDLGGIGTDSADVNVSAEMEKGRNVRPSCFDGASALRRFAARRTVLVSANGDCAAG